MSGGDRWHISFHEGLGFRASPTLHTMFYSVDLLSLKGGRMNMIWLLGTQRLGKPVLSEMDEFDVFRFCILKFLRDKTALIKKKKAELLRTDLIALCKELVTR